MQRAAVEIEPHFRVDVLVRERPRAALGVGRDEVRAAHAAAERISVRLIKVVCRGAARRRNEVLR